MFKPLVVFLISVITSVAVAGQTPDTQKDDAANAPKPAGAAQLQRNLAFPGGVSLVFLIRELAKDLDHNVIFDVDSRLENRTVRIDIENVTTAEALNYILLQEGLISEVVGSRTILVAHQTRTPAFPLIGAGLTPLGDQLAYFFGVDRGVLINNVYDDSPAAKAGLKAGDVITEINGVPISGSFGLRDVITKKNGVDLVFKVMRDRKPLAISVTPRKAIE
ncbi:MAG: PDZ domain-containing protein [Pyrinomonadaceae bacterium]